MNVETPLECQRALFDMPREVCFLNAGAWAPLPLSSVEIGREGVARKSQPWKLDTSLQQEQCEAAREAAAALIGAEAQDVAIIPSISYGVAVAARALKLPADSRVIVLDNDHASPVLEWTSQGEGLNMKVHTVSVRSDGDWTAALLEAIEKEGPKGLALVSVSNVHWADGGMIDMDSVAAETRRWGAALLIDATHAVGVIDMDVRRLDPDFMLFPTYKWLLGPYGRSFLYIARRRQDAIPLEQTMSGRRRVRAEDDIYFSDLSYQPDARRFDMGQRDFFISLDMARHGMELMHGWGRNAVRTRLEMLTGYLADGLRDSGLPVTTSSPHVRSPHILCVAFDGGMPDGIAGMLKAKNVHVAPRLGRLRVSPHVYNDETDCQRFIEALNEVLGETRPK